MTDLKLRWIGSRMYVKRAAFGGYGNKLCINSVHNFFSWLRSDLIANHVDNWCGSHFLERLLIADAISTAPLYVVVFASHK